MIVDDFGYRYEPDRGKRDASVVFHDKEKIVFALNGLKQLFDLLFESSSEARDTAVQ